jgi:hypothetical protein
VCLAERNPPSEPVMAGFAGVFRIPCGSTPHDREIVMPQRTRSTDRNTRRRRAIPPLILAQCLWLAAPSWAEAPSGGTYRISKQALVGGGARSTGGSYVLVATVGQSVAGQTDGDGALIQQGFHAAAAPRPEHLFNDSFE